MDPYIYQPYPYPVGAWPSNPTYFQPMPAYSSYGAPTPAFTPYAPSAPAIVSQAATAQVMPNPIILPPNPTATGVPAMMPGMLNSTFTPTAGLVPLTQELEESDSNPEEPIVPHLNLHPPSPPIVYSYHKSKCRKSRSQGRSRSASRSHSRGRYERPIVYTTCCERDNCDGRRCIHRGDYVSLIPSYSSGSSSSGSSGASSSSASSYSRSHRRSSSRPGHSHREKTSWRDYYPSEIYDTHSRPEPTVLRPSTPSPPKLRSCFLSRKPKPFTMYDWANKAAMLAPVTQSQAKHFHPDGVELHPLLDRDTTTLFFSVLDSKKYITLQDGSSIVPVESHHATSPPLIKMEINNWYEGTPVVLENPNGVTLGEVIDGILRNARTSVAHSEVRKWSEGRLGIVYHWHWYNRARVAGMRRHLTIGDTYGGHTAFEGLMTAQKAKLVDSRARGLPHCSMVLCLGTDGNIPGLRPLSDFPR